MSAPGTTDLLLIRAAGNGEITYGRLPEGESTWCATHGFTWNGTRMDYSASAAVHNLAVDGYLAYDEDSDHTVVAVTADGREAVR